MKTTTVATTTTPTCDNCGLPDASRVSLDSDVAHCRLCKGLSPKGLKDRRVAAVKAGRLGLTALVTKENLKSGPAKAKAPKIAVVAPADAPVEPKADPAEPSKPAAPLRIVTEEQVITTDPTPPKLAPTTRTVIVDAQLLRDVLAALPGELVRLYRSGLDPKTLVLEAADPDHGVFARATIPTDNDQLFDQHTLVRANMAKALKGRAGSVILREDLAKTGTVTIAHRTQPAIVLHEAVKAFPSNQPMAWAACWGPKGKNERLCQLPSLDLEWALAHAVDIIDAKKGPHFLAGIRMVNGSVIGSNGASMHLARVKPTKGTFPDAFLPVAFGEAFIDLVNALGVQNEWPITLGQTEKGHVYVSSSIGPTRIEIQGVPVGAVFPDEKIGKLLPAGEDVRAQFVLKADVLADRMDKLLEHMKGGELPCRWDLDATDLRVGVEGFTVSCSVRGVGGEKATFHLNPALVRAAMDTEDEAEGVLFRVTKQGTVAVGTVDGLLERTSVIACQNVEEKAPAQPAKKPRKAKVTTK